MKKANFIVSIVCAILGVGVIMIASGYPDAEAYGTGVPGPGLWPIVISGVMLVCAALLMFKTLKMKPEDDDTEVILWSADTRRVYISMLILLIYTIILEPVGFILSTIAMLLIFIQWFSKKKWYMSLIISAALSLGIYSIFKFVLNVPIDFGFFAL